MKKVTVVIPCYNEEASLPLMYEALCKLAASSSNYEWFYGCKDCGGYGIILVNSAFADSGEDEDKMVDTCQDCNMYMRGGVVWFCPVLVAAK